jgi:hypothetical protein
LDKKVEGRRIRLLARGRFARAVAWRRNTAEGEPHYMQGSSTVEERLRFKFTPVLNWKQRPDESVKAILVGWEKTVHIWQQEYGWEEYLWRYTYEQPHTQPAEVSFETWIDNHYQEEYPYLEHDVWEWGKTLVKGRHIINPTGDEQSGFAFQFD